MKHGKRKKKTAPVATTVAEPAASIAVAPTQSAVSTGASKQPQSSAAPSIDYALSATCTIREGAALKSALLGLVDADQGVSIDVNAVERIDTAALQILCAFVRERRVRGRRTQWVGSPSAFAEAVETLGLTQALGFTAEQAA